MLPSYSLPCTLADAKRILIKVFGVALMSLRTFGVDSIRSLLNDVIERTKIAKEPTEFPSAQGKCLAGNYG